MQKLSKREEQIMQILWEKEKSFVKEIVEAFPEPKPHYNTIATLVKILEEKKGFLAHETFGNSHRYYPLISKEKYQKQEIGTFIKQYFNNSYKNLVTYFAEEENISESELEEILHLIKKNKS